MRGINKVILLGTVGKDPELRQTTSGQSVCNFSVATSEKYKDVETTEWHNITVFGKLAELVASYSGKGLKIYVEGKIQTNHWEKDGQKMTSKGVLGYAVEIVEFRKDSNNAAEEFAGGQQAQAPDFDDDIPF